MTRLFINMESINFRKMDEHLGKVLGDSAYSSLGHSAYSSNSQFHAKMEDMNKHPSSNPSSKSSGSAGYAKNMDSGSRLKTLARYLQNIKELPHFPEEIKTRIAKPHTLSEDLCCIDEQKISKYKVKKEDESINIIGRQFCISPTSQAAYNNIKHRRKKIGSQEHLSSRDVERDENIVKDGFCVAVSLQDGMVHHSTERISNILGYPKDMLIGRSFLKFLHPKDREVFIGQVNKNAIFPENNMSECEELVPAKRISSNSESFFSRIRRYNGLKTGFGVKERQTKYSNFKLRICFNEGNFDSLHKASIQVQGISIYIFITAIPLQQAYTTPNQEGPIKLKNGQDFFISKHSSSCLFTFLDENSILFWGHFPQDLQGRDIFEYIHPDDFLIIKESFEKILSMKLFKSQPYRLKTMNGDFIWVATAWSCFINPWSHNLEFIQGLHTVIKGPTNPNIFMASSNSLIRFQDSECVENKNETVINEIKTLVKNSSHRYHASNNISLNSIKTAKELTSFMGSLIQEATKIENVELIKPVLSGNLAIGNISPHNASSSEIPPNYTQLNYNENLARFFNSQPKTVSEEDMLPGFTYSPPSYDDSVLEQQERKSIERNLDKKKETEDGHIEDYGGSAEGSGQGSGEQHGSGRGQTVSGSGEDNAKNSSSLQIGLSAGHNQPGGEECIMPQDGYTSGSGSSSRFSEGIKDAYKPPALTEELLIKHNQDMEKYMLSEFKEAKRIRETRLRGKEKTDQENSSKKALKNIVKQEENVDSGPGHHSFKKDPLPKINIPDSIKVEDSRSQTFNDIYVSSPSNLTLPVDIKDEVATDEPKLSK